MRIEFTVLGEAVTQGSKTRLGRRVVNDNRARLDPWREAVRHEAALVMDGRRPMTGPVAVHLRVTRTRPKSHYRANGDLNPRTATNFPTGRNSGDVDKLARAVLDAMTAAGVWGDDAQVTELAVWKEWCDRLVAPSAHVTAFEVASWG